MNQKQIEVFHAVMTHHTASRAAQVLFMSQPAVSKHIQQLERSLGFDLFDRVKGRLVPTPEGQLFHKEVSLSFIGITQLSQAATRIRDFGSGELRIAGLSSLSTSIIPLALKGFQDQHPGVAISYQTRLSSEIRDMVASGQIDIGLAADEIDTSGVDAVPYCKYKAVIALPPNHQLAEKPQIHPSDLHGESYIALSPEDTTRRESEVIMRGFNSSPRIVFETPFSATVCAMVHAGLGCGMVNPVTVPNYVTRGLVVKPFSANVYFRALLLFPTCKGKSIIVQDCISELKEALKKIDIVSYLS